MKQFTYRFIGFLLYFALFFIVINALFVAVLAKTDWNFRNRIESLRFEDPDFDLLVLGASTSFDAFDAELLTKNGIKSYNLAMGGTTIKTSYIQLKEYLEKYTVKPEYVLLGHNSPYEKNVDSEEIHPIVELTMSDHKYTMKDVPVLKLKWLGFEFLKKVVSSKHREAVLAQGQMKFRKAIPDHTDFSDSYLEFDLFETSFWFGEIARLCNQYDLKLIIIEMPGIKATQNLSEVGPYELHFENGETATLFNLNSREFCTLFDSETDWIGNSHLNEYGAIKFTTRLLDMVNKDAISLYQ